MSLFDLQGPPAWLGLAFAAVALPLAGATIAFYLLRRTPHRLWWSVAGGAVLAAGLLAAAALLFALTHMPD
jgi:hypothetical protein